MLTARKLYTYAGSFLPVEISDNLHSAADILHFMAVEGYRDTKDSSTGISTKATASNGLTVCANGYVYYDKSDSPRRITAQTQYLS